MIESRETTRDVPPEDMLRVENMRVSFAQGRREPVRAVRDVSFAIPPGKTLGLVGESGCGKTTLSRALLGLIPCEGSIYLQGKRVDWRKSGREMRQKMQLIFQDPYASLNPRFTVEQTLHEPLWVHFQWKRTQRATRVRRIMDLTGLADAWRGKYPHEFSGGQRQRIAIARALILEPAFVIADEPVSSLDVSIQAQILNLLRDMKRELGLTMLFISHDLAVVRHVADEVAVMRTGEMLESGPTRKVLVHPEHPYTRALLAAMPQTRRQTDDEEGRGQNDGMTE
ncbi:MAG: ATP-binding cassette domain-containing protein [Kiritimatiellae bacterium]|nr:ATP-binding cassette domain-containing protein [Kiritimatiellia bacterium]